MRFVSNMKSLMSLAGTFVSVWSARRLGLTLRHVPFVYIDVTDRCNSRCRMCDIWKIRSGSPPELSTDEWLSIRPALRSLRTRVLSIGGGEPTLRDDIETLISGFHEMGLAVHMNTNAQLIDRARARSLIDAGLSIAAISCEHPDPEGYKKVRGVDGLAQVAEAIGHFRSGPKPIAISINVVVSRLNQDAIERMAEQAIAWGVQKLQFIPVHMHLQHQGMDPAILRPLIPAPEDMPQIKEALLRAVHHLRSHGIGTNSLPFIRRFDKAHDPGRWVPCYAGTLFVMVDSFGQVMPCYQYRTGLNIRQTPLDEIVRSQAFQEARKSVARCQVACWDTGSAEPSVRLHLPYLLLHPIEVYSQARMHLP